MPDDMEVCGCNGVCKGTIVKAIKEKGLFTLDDVRKHTKASSSCGSCTGLVEQILPPPSAATISRPTRRTSRCAAAPSTRTKKCARAIREQNLLTIPEVMTVHGMDDAQRLRHLPPGAELLPARRPGRTRRWTIRSRASSTSARTPTSRKTAPIRWCRACGAASPRAAELRAHRRRRRQIQDPDGQSHRRPAHRSARREKRRPARRVARSRHAVGPRLWQGAAHGEDLRRLRMVPLRRAGLDQDGHRAREGPVAHVRAAQGQARGVGLPAQLRRGDDQGRRRDRRRFRLGNLCRRQRRHQGRGRAVSVQGEDARGSAGIRRRLPAALPRRRRVISTAPCITSRASGSITSSSASSRMPETARRCMRGCVSRCRASPIRGASAPPASRRANSNCWRPER